MGYDYLFTLLPLTVDSHGWHNVHIQAFNIVCVVSYRTPFLVSTNARTLWNRRQSISRMCNGDGVYILLRVHELAATSAAAKSQHTPSCMQELRSHMQRFSLTADTVTALLYAGVVAAARFRGNDQSHLPRAPLHERTVSQRLSPIQRIP